MEGKKLLKPLVTLILFIFSANFLANKFYWYSSVWYFDAVMHFLGGFWVGLAALYILQPGSVRRKTVWSVLGAVLAVGLGWEVFEFAVDKAISENPFNLFDTSSDLLFDLAGGCAALFYYFRKTMSRGSSGMRSN